MFNKTSPSLREKLMQLNSEFLSRFSLEDDDSAINSSSGSNDLIESIFEGDLDKNCCTS